MVLLVLLDPTVRRENLDLRGPLDLPVPVEFLVTEEKPVLLVPLVLLVHQVQMDSLVLKENRVKGDRKVTLVLPALRDPPELQVLRDQLVCLDQRGLVVLKDLLVPQVSLELLVELDRQVLMATLVLLVLLALLVKMVPRVYEVMVVLLEDRVMLAYVGQPVLRARRESLVKMVLLVRMAHQVLRVWLDSVVLLDFLDSVVKEVFLACLDLLGSLGNKGLLVDLEIVDPQDL